MASLFKTSERKTLRPHQQEAIDLLRDSLKRGNKRTVLQAGTGFGKTLTSATIIRRAIERGKQVVFTVPRISLVEQAVEEFEAEGIDRIGVIQADHWRRDTFAPLQVASVQTLARRDFLPCADMVIVDECHLSPKPIYRWMKEKPEMPFLGLSATPWKKGMGDHWQDLVSPISLADLIDKGFLSPFTVYAPSHPDVSGVKVGASGDYQKNQLSEVMQETRLVADVVDTWKQRAAGLPTLVFAVDLAHARKIQAAFAAGGIEMGYVEAKTETDERRRLLDQMERGAIAGVVSVGTMTTGVDADVRCVVLARPTKSEMFHVQAIGRALRTAPGKGRAIILDHADNHARLGFVTDIHYDRLLTGQEKREPKQHERPERLPRECPSCGTLKPAGPCPACGFEPTRQSDIEFEEGVLEEITPEKKPKEPTKSDKQAFWSGLLHIADRRNRSRGWASHTYKERFGVRPRGLEDWPIEPLPEVSSYVKARDIRYAKRREKANG